MSPAGDEEVNEVQPAPTSLLRRLLKACAWIVGGIGVLFLLLVLLLVGFLFCFFGQVPRSYPPMADPIEPPSSTEYAAFELDGFDSPYLGHTGSWDGKGGALWGSSKIPDLDKEVGMGLRWTFMPVYWCALEPDGPLDLSSATPLAWRELDTFVIEAQKRRLNILIQAPVVGGNAGGPPAWAGRREPGKSAPADMEAAAAFAGKLAERYAPGGTLSASQGWGQQYGVRAWELDNEPESYFTHWKEQAGDYAEFATRVAARIKQADPRALIFVPATASVRDSWPWIRAALDADGLSGSPEYRRRGVPYSIGTVAKGVSFHIYEGLNTTFSGSDETLERALGELVDVFNQGENRAAGFSYARKREYWHTEGNFDFIGWLSAERRAAWHIQFFTRAFAAGVRKVCVMDASDRERAAVRGYVQTLPHPFPMRPADTEVKLLSGHATTFRHVDGPRPEAGQVWVLWAVAGQGDAQVEVPVLRGRVTLVQVDGSITEHQPSGHTLTVNLKGDSKMAPPVLVVDRPADEDRTEPR